MEEIKQAFKPIRKGIIRIILSGFDGRRIVLEGVLDEDPAIEICVAIEDAGYGEGNLAKRIKTYREEK